jgi:hypothetical protein
MRVSRGLAAALIVGLALAAYLAGTAPDVLFGDGAELQAAGSTGGIAHPSGYPAFLLAARLFAHLPLGNAAHRLNVMSAVCGAAAAGTLLLVLFELGLSTAAAAAGALAYAASFTLVWAAERCEVYTLAIALFLIALWRSLVAIRTRSPRAAGAAAFLLGLAMTGHLVFGPPVLLLSALVALPLPLAAPRRVAAWLGLAALFALGLSPYATLAVADRLNAATNYLRLVVEPAGGQFGLTPETFATPWTRIAWLVFGPEAHPVALAWHPRVALANLGAAAVRLFVFEFGPAGLVLAALGARRLAGVGARAAALAGVAGLALAASALAIERRMLAIFLIPCGIVVAVLIAAGIDAALARLAPRAGARPWRSRWRSSSRSRTSCAPARPRPALSAGRPSRTGSRAARGWCRRCATRSRRARSARRRSPRSRAGRSWRGSGARSWCSSTSRRSRGAAPTWRSIPGTPRTACASSAGSARTTCASTRSCCSDPSRRCARCSCAPTRWRWPAAAT